MVRGIVVTCTVGGVDVVAAAVVVVVLSSPLMQGILVAIAVTAVRSVGLMVAAAEIKSAMTAVLVARESKSRVLVESSHWEIAATSEFNWASERSPPENVPNWAEPRAERARRVVAAKVDLGRGDIMISDCLL